MTNTWMVVLGAGAASMAIKASGTLLLGRRDLPAALQPILALLAPALLSALVATQVFALGAALTVDARVGGLLVAALGARYRLPPVVVLALAVVTTALLRHFL